MNKLNYLIPGIFLLFFINFQTGEILAQRQLQDENRIKSIDLSKKNYYEIIFTKSDRKQLKKANSYLADAQKYMLEYKSYQKEIENLYTIAKATSSSKTSANSLEKARKLEKKSLKSGNKSIDYFKKATDIKTNIYTSSINRARLMDNSTHAEAGKELESKAKANFEKAKEKIRTAPIHDPQLNLKVLFEANDLILEALALQENAFAIYKKDPQINPDDVYFVPEKIVIVPDSGKVIPIDSVLFPVYTEQYNPFTDPNLYHSQIDKILPHLKISPEENKLLAESSRKNQYANDLLKQVDDAYIVVDSLNFIADRTKDFTQRDKLRNAAIEKEQQAFYKLTNATNIQLDVNEIRYKIYKAHFPKTDPKKISPEIEQAKKYEIASEQYYLKAKNEISQANKLTFQSEQYLQKMGANDMLLYSLQLQESAYGIYLNIKDINIFKPDSLPGKNQIISSTKNVKQEETSKNLSWEVSKTYSYSKERPKPVIYKIKNGVVFLVQLGIFKGIIPADNFTNIQPIVYDEFSNNPYRRFMVGEYRSEEAAEIALAKLKKMGYDDAYIVSMVNGQRKSYSAGKESANLNDENYNNSKKLELAKLSGQEADDINVEITPKEGIVSGNNIKNTKGLVYLVQLGMYLKPITYDELKNLQPIYTDMISGKGTRYMLGIYSSLSEARQESQRAVSNGFVDAYVIAYLDGKHISLDKAKSLEAKQGGSVNNEPVISSGSIIFMVQIGAYREKLSPAEENKLKAQYSPRSIEIRMSEEMNLYLVGNYKSYKDADFLKKKLINEGHEGVFVVAFNGTKKIPVDQAIKLNKNK